jgi:hypothetical protein
MQTLKCLHTGNDVPYTIIDGIDLRTAVSLDLDWNEEKAKIFGELIAENPDAFSSPERFDELLVGYQLTDYHWDWTKKAALCRTDEYFWFFLQAEGKVQAACIIKHPKASREDSAGIFYIDYLAVAYWNREREGYARKFGGVGTKLLVHAINYSINTLGYRPGFSLHALPSSEGYYRKLNMTDYGIDTAYQNLRYFEAPAPVANSIAQGAA